MRAGCAYRVSISGAIPCPGPAVTDPSVWSDIRAMLIPAGYRRPARMARRGARSAAGPRRRWQPDHRAGRIAAMRVFATLADFAAASGEHLGYSPWREVTQQQVDGFADITGDRQWIHVDPERAAASQFGGTIAHGYLTLA